MVGLRQARVVALEAEGLMEPAGHAAIERAKETGGWSALDRVEALEVPRDLAAALDSHARARRNFDAFRPRRGG